MNPTSTPWTNGYGKGITGPNTPSLCGVTVHDHLAYTNWQKQPDGTPRPPREHNVISVNGDTIAITVGSRRHANAEFIVRACNSLDELVTAAKALLQNPHKVTSEDWERLALAVTKAETKVEECIEDSK